MDNYISTPLEIMESAYKMQILNQQLSYSILKSDYITEANGDTSAIKKIGNWIKETTANIIATIRKWLAAIGKFFTKTLPAALKRFVDRIFGFCKKKENVKNIKIPEETPEEDKKEIIEIANDINKVNHAKAVQELTQPENEDKNVTTATKKAIEEKEEEVAERIINWRPKNLDQMKKEMDEALEKGYVINVNGKDNSEYTTKCPRVKEPIEKSLKFIAEMCQTAVDQMTDLLKGGLNGDLASADPKSTYDQLKDAWDKYIYKFSYDSQKTYLVETRKIISRNEISKLPPEDVKLGDIKKQMALFQSNKDADKIYKSAQKEADAFFAAVAELEKAYKKTKHAASGQQFVDIITKIANVYMQYVSDATKDYTAYINFGIKAYTYALAGRWNPRGPKDIQ